MSAFIQPRLTVVTPCRNDKDFILACLQNVTAQASDEIEHLVMDAASSDGTTEIVREYARRHPHVRLVSEPDQGQADALNKGVRLAQGKIIGSLNADDWYQPDTLNQALKCFVDLPEPGLVVGNCQLWDNAGRAMEINRPSRLQLTDLLLGVQHCPFPFNPSAYFYHRSLHEQLGFYSLNPAEPFDVDFILRAVQKARVRYMDELWGNFRYREGAKTYDDIRTGRDMIKLSRLFSRLEAGLSRAQRQELEAKRKSTALPVPAAPPHATKQARPPSVSVVITSYNYRQYVCDAVESALNQSYPPLQVVIVDDGSTDGSPELLRNRYADDPRVRLLIEKNQGQLSAFTKGAWPCTGDVICFLDADDHWDSDYLEMVAQAYAEHPNVEFMHANLKFTGKKMGTYFHRFVDQDQGYSMLLAYHTMAWIGSPTSALSLRRALCQKILTVPESFFQDWRVRADDVLVFGASLFGARKRYLGQARVNYCVHEANHWFRVPENEIDAFRRAWAIRRLFHYWVRNANVYDADFQSPAMAPILECHSRPYLSWDEMCLYVKAALEVRSKFWSPSIRLRQVISIVRHYLKLAVRNHLVLAKVRQNGKAHEATLMH